MAQAQLEKFIAMVANDPARLQEASGGEEDLQKGARNVVQYAKSQGCDITEEEARGLLAQRAGELKDAQLDEVAGGAIYMAPGNEVGLVPAVQTQMGDGSVKPGGYDLKYGLKIDMRK
jgi:hypothetical protein